MWTRRRHAVSRADVGFLMKQPQRRADDCELRLADESPAPLCHPPWRSAQGGLGGGEALPQPGSHGRGVLVAAAFQFPLGFGRALLAE